MSGLASRVYFTVIDIKKAAKLKRYHSVWGLNTNVNNILRNFEKPLLISIFFSNMKIKKLKGGTPVVVLPTFHRVFQ